MGWEWELKFYSHGNPVGYTLLSGGHFSLKTCIEWKLYYYDGMEDLHITGSVQQKIQAQSRRAGNFCWMKAWSWGMSFCDKYKVYNWHPTQFPFIFYVNQIFAIFTYLMQIPKKLLIKF